jgi:taurine dioxygenase
VVYHFTAAQEQNRFGFPRGLRVAQRNPKAEAALAQYRRDFPPVVHPLVITQHETGRKVLKLSPMHAQAILGMDAAESDALLHELADHLVDPRFAYFHTWQVDDAIVWDNWRTIHSATGVPFDVERLAQRTTLVGDYKLGRYLDPAERHGGPRRRFDD